MPIEHFPPLEPDIVTLTTHDDGVAEIVMDNPPVNALPVEGWFALAEALATAGANPRCASSSSGRKGAASTRASTSRRCSATRGSVR